MALDQAKQTQLALQEQPTPTRATSSEQSSESDGSEAFSDSEAYRSLPSRELQQELELQPSTEQQLDFEYSPLNGDSDVDSELGSSSDESIALLAHEMLCCEHDSETDSEQEDNEDDDEDDDENEDGDALGQDDNAFTEAQHTYALLMCSEDDEDLELDQQQLQQHQQQPQQQPKLHDLKHPHTSSAPDSLLGQANEMAKTEMNYNAGK